MSFPDKAFPISWDQFHRDARALSWRLAGLMQEWEAIIAIARGGLVPATVVSRELGIRYVDTVCIASYHNYQRSEVNLLKPVPEKFLETKGENILIIDDLTDTGKTLEYLHNKLPKAHFATIYSKPQGRPFVDTYITEVSQDTWIYFPWDMGFSYQAPINKNQED